MYIVTSNYTYDSIKVADKEGMELIKNFWQSYGIEVKVEEVENDGTEASNEKVKEIIEIAKLFMSQIGLELDTIKKLMNYKYN